MFKKSVLSVLLSLVCCVYSFGQTQEEIITQMTAQMSYDACHMLGTEATCKAADVLLYKSNTVDYWRTKCTDMGATQQQLASADSLRDAGQLYWAQGMVHILSGNANQSDGDPLYGEGATYWTAGCYTNACYFYLQSIPYHDSGYDDYAAAYQDLDGNPWSAFQQYQYAVMEYQMLYEQLCGPGI